MENKDPKAVAADVMNKRRSSDAEKAVKNARVVLFIISGLVLLVAVFRYFNNVGDEYELIGSIVEAAIYAGLGFWSRKKPFVSILIALILFLLSQAFLAYIDPSNLYRGSFFKIIIIIALVNALARTKDLKKKKEKHEGLLDDNL